MSEMITFLHRHCIGEEKQRLKIRSAAECFTFWKRRPEKLDRRWLKYKRWWWSSAETLTCLDIIRLVEFLRELIKFLYSHYLGLGNEQLKRWVLRCFLRADIEDADVTFCGRVFHGRETAIGKARFLLLTNIHPLNPSAPHSDVYISIRK